MDKKVEFCLTPQVRSSLRLSKNSHITQSTPFTKDGKSPLKPKFLLPNFRIEEDSMVATNTYNLTTGNNLTSNSTTGQPSVRERSLYPQQNTGQIERICLEFEYLRLKLHNQKCEKKLDESNKLIEKNIIRAVEVQRKKQDSIVQSCLSLERKMQLAELKEKSDLILELLDDLFPGDVAKQLTDQLARYGAILVPALDTFTIVNIKNGSYFNELLPMVNKEEFSELMDANNELAERMSVIQLEKSKWCQTIAKLKLLSEEFQRLAGLVRCLSKKGLL